MTMSLTLLLGNSIFKDLIYKYPEILKKVYMGLLCSIERMRSGDTWDCELVRRTSDMLIAIGEYNEFEQILLIDSKRFFTSEGE